MSDQQSEITPTARPSFEEFVSTEPTLTPEQRSLIVDIYKTWQR